MTNQKVLGFFILIFLLCGTLYYHRNFETEHWRQPKSHLKRLSKAEETGSEDYYVRHCTTDSILGRTPIGLQTVSFEVPSGSSPEIADNRKSSFEKIFQNQEWISENERNKTRQASGPGSTLHYAQEAIGALHLIITRLKRELGVDRIRMLDIPCGDMVWMSRFLKTREDVHYTGLDIVPDLISRHQKDFIDQSNWRFRVQDIVRNGLNESYDLILCRMMLQHLFNHDVMTVLKHFSQSGSRFLLTTSFSRTMANVELPTISVRYRQLNLELPPVSLIPPVCFVRDGEKDDMHGRNHFLGLWPLPIRRVKSCNSTASFRISGFGVDFFSCTKWS